MLSMVSFVVLLMLLLVVTEIIAVVFKITGLDIDKARFQIISILTHTGFTTRESELIAQHPLRRKIASYLMIVSYGAQISLISILINMITTTNRQSLLILLAIVLGLALAVVVIARSRFVISSLDSLVERLVLRQMKKTGRHRSVDEVLKLNGDFGVSEMILNDESHLVGMQLKDAKLKQRQIQVLNVDRGEQIIHFPRADLVFEAADRVLIYGKIDSIRDLILEQENAAQEKQ